MTIVLTSTQAREWAKARPDPVADLIETLAALRGYERIARLYYGEDEHKFALEACSPVRGDADAAWARETPDPVSELGEFRWVLNQFERAARLDYGSPPHANALLYANSRLDAAIDMAGLEPLEGGF